MYVREKINSVQIQFLQIELDTKETLILIWNVNLPEQILFGNYF